MNYLRAEHIKRHTRVRFERRPHTRWDWLGVAIILGAAFIAANFISNQQGVFEDIAALQNFLDGEQKEAIKSMIERR